MTEVLIDKAGFPFVSRYDVYIPNVTFIGWHKSYAQAESQVDSIKKLIQHLIKPKLMTEEKLYELVEQQYIGSLKQIEPLLNYEKLIIKDICKIILTNFTLTDKNARH